MYLPSIILDGVCVCLGYVCGAIYRMLRVLDIVAMAHPESSASVSGGNAAPHRGRFDFMSLSRTVLETKRGLAIGLNSSRLTGSTTLRAQNIWIRIGGGTFNGKSYANHGREKLQLATVRERDLQGREMEATGLSKAIEPSRQPTATKREAIPLRKYNAMWQAPLRHLLVSSAHRYTISKSDRPHCCTTVFG